LFAAACLLIFLADCLQASERVRRICIPNQDGSGWICGTEDEPPQAPAAPRRERAPPTPPRFLADPHGTRTLPLVPIARPTPQRPAAVEVSPVPEAATTVAPLPEPADAERTAPEPAAEPVRELPPADRAPIPAPQPEAEPAGPQPQPAAPEPEPVMPGPEPVAPPLQDQPAPESPVPESPAPEPFAPTASREAADPAAPEPPAADVAVAPSADVPAPIEAPGPEPSPAQVPIAPQPPGQRVPAGPWRVDAAMRAGADTWMLQLAHGPDLQALARLAGELGLPADRLFLLPLERERAPWWLLAMGLFDSPEQAREAAGSLPSAAGLRGVWPRRAEPLQNEIERARRIHAPP
jgi:septal ring-binding cell division protein DamX